MNREALAAALNILQTISRDRIRTHERKAPPGRGNKKGGRPPDLESEIRRQRVAKLLDETNPLTGRRWTEAEMAALLGVSRVSVQRHKKALRANR